MISTSLLRFSIKEYINSTHSMNFFVNFFELAKHEFKAER